MDLFFIFVSLFLCLFISFGVAEEEEQDFFPWLPTRAPTLAVPEGPGSKSSLASLLGPVTPVNNSTSDQLCPFVRARYIVSIKLDDAPVLRGPATEFTVPDPATGFPVLVVGLTAGGFPPLIVVPSTRDGCLPSPFSFVVGVIGTSHPAQP